MNKQVLPFILKAAYDFFEDEEEEKTICANIENFVEDIVPKFDNRQFAEHFRLHPTTFEHLMSKITVVIPQVVKCGQPQIKLDKQLLLGLWFLATTETLRSIANRFGVSKSTVWEVLQRVVNCINEMNRIYKIISWPTEQQAIANMQSFQHATGFPGIIGCIDGSHIKIPAPKEHPESYFNRKKFYSICLQGVCNRDKLFIDIFTGMPGSCHDARVFQRSDLFLRIQDEEVTFPFNGHIIGDLAYPLCKQLLVGFKDTGNLMERQKNFNRKLSKARVVIEQSFAILKGRFRRLKYMETRKLDIICASIMASCVLHNICLLQGENPEELIDIAQEIEQNRNINIIEEPLNDNVRQEAAAKRIFIMNNL